MRFMSPPSPPNNSHVRPFPVSIVVFFFFSLLFYLRFVFIFVRLNQVLFPRLGAILLRGDHKFVLPGRRCNSAFVLMPDTILHCVSCDSLGYQSPPKVGQLKRIKKKTQCLFFLDVVCWGSLPQLLGLILMSSLRCAL